MILRWPWKHQASDLHLALSWSGQTLAYVLARLHADGATEVLKFGVERQIGDDREALVHKLKSLGLKGHKVRVMLRPEQYQLFQIDAPAVAPDEMRLAARYQIKEMLDASMDDITLDVMQVGDGRQKGTGQLFVVVATHVVVQGILDLCEAMHWKVSVLDIQECAQRNLQSALASHEGHVNVANVALVLLDRLQAMLTISANEELFYTRRFDLPEGFLADSWEQVNGMEGKLTTSSISLAHGNGFGNDDQAQRFLVEVQRSLDLWDRFWTGMPLNSIWVYAGARSDDVSKWLALQLGHKVLPMDINPLFPGFYGGSIVNQAMCLPLLGVLLRPEDPGS